MKKMPYQNLNRWCGARAAMTGKMLGNAEGLHGDLKGIKGNSYVQRC
jgi:hypothetical protein